MDSGYKVCQKDTVYEFTEKKSRFITYLACVDNEADAKAFIEAIRQKHRDATHNCIAYRLREPRIERFSDDGEPAGTAGMPMLEVLKKEEVFDVCCVVTRYFGGILLGGGGLIRAYSRGVSGALAQSGFASRLASVSFTLTYAYSNHNSLLKLVENTSHNLVSEQFSDKVSVTLSLVKSDYDAFIDKVRDIMCGDVEVSGTAYGFDSFN